ncbi:stage V sporulation protein AA [Anaeromicropila populeti]|uniref:Stage V sporulation protein AA n=1 Tax=Anaeromicropila populeti TaxID=37658 RepID=A0A1I6JQP4_9FIRM|nr:stage V sporulation protein AA [Anaeromicropila populeti]SFR81274.1 stage V sporulation protein AA [Anaeromicropila populeti]
MIKLYISMNQRVQVMKREVYLDDIASCYCSDLEVLNKIRKIELFHLGQENLIVCSALVVIEKINEKYLDIEVINMGETDFIIEYLQKKKKNMLFEYFKIVVVSFTVFCGGAFAIMTFNSDVGVKELFQRLYEIILGDNGANSKILEISYSIGVSLGVISFYNHMFRKKIEPDPTPIQIEMRQYESQVNDTIIMDANREGETMNVP